MKQVLVIEDQPSDLQVAAKAAESSGFSDVEARSSVSAARLYLEKGLEGTGPLPGVIILDLDLGYESGFELLRFWHSEPRLSQIPLIVWTILGDRYQEVCAMFKVKAYISKGDGAAELRSILDDLARPAS